MPPNPLTLKQRLAALSANIQSSSRSSSDMPPDSPSGKRRAFFKQPFGRGPSADAGTGEPYGQERIQEVMNRLIFQAGVDYETRPMIVMCASAMPDPREVSYDLLLSRILSYLDLYVESDYTVVFLAAGNRNSPGWNWVWKAYRSLSRKYRKNLKRLYVVHSNFFTKMLFSAAGAIISPKFFRKITYINTLSELAYHVPLTQIDIPPAVYQENLKHEKQINLPVMSRSDLFGVPLEELMGFDGEKGGLPRVVKDCIQYLRSTGLHDEGLFRRSPNSVLLKQAAQAYDRGHVVSLETFGDPHLAAVLLKKYLHDLPEPIFPERLYPVIRRCPPPTSDPDDMSSIMYIRETLLPELPPCVYILLSNVLHLLHEVQLRSASNRMDAHNLTVVICPNLVSSSNPMRDVMMCSVPNAPTLFDTARAGAPDPRVPAHPMHNAAALAEGKTTLGMVVKLCIERYYEVFDELPDRTEALSQEVVHAPNPFADMPSPGSPSNNRDSAFLDDEEIDDAMLVMPIGPSASSRFQQQSGSGSPAPTGSSTFRPRHQTSQSRDATARSTHTGFGGQGGGGGSAYATVNKARSTISIERGNPSRKGSIAVGRNTQRGKGAGAGVQAIGITAEGFFSAPDAPPVPTLPSHR
ncbi:Rho GTPase activation protein [Trametes versicolor FP-101664 SS1]|uniref:Rho GTPase activation protein n=1 Tax=Trametes versicolor (strain FP-101664) TaxID=717944 RepID=UPI0004623256|nr:Rho GTPase activation protein [Trametes versicolor FP-101664 SS1]EIW59301.1 Rho GTPase activation protein [Trametes versicolor FP-101664 SS1]